MRGKMGGVFFVSVLVSGFSSTPRSTRTIEGVG